MENFTDMYTILEDHTGEDGYSNWRKNSVPKYNGKFKLEHGFVSNPEKYNPYPPIYNS